MAITAATLGSFAATAGATFPGENGLLASQGGGLQVTDPAGTVRTLIHPIGPGPDWDYPTDPEFLADGERITYAYDGDILVSSTDGTERVNLTADQTPPAADPSPSPADQIAFTRHTTPVAGRALFVMAPDGDDVQQITSGEVQDKNPAWSPDGDRIVFVRTALGEDGYLDGSPGIYAVDPDGTDLTELIAPGQPYVSEPTFSPDGDHILFLRSGLVHLMNEDGTDLHRAVDPDPGAGPARRSGVPRWHPACLFANVLFELRHVGMQRGRLAHHQHRGRRRAPDARRGRLPARHRLGARARGRSSATRRLLRRPGCGHRRDPAPRHDHGDGWSGRDRDPSRT
jgi:dipeptidyl aminopeptidase/acylaminoacyl peptidase